MTAKTKNVSVRLDAAIADLIDEEAAARKQDRSEFLRNLISAALTADGDGDGDVREELRAIREELRSARGQVRRVREDVATLALGLLVTVGRQEPEKAKAWVAQHLSRELDR
jgi:Arc/MetJ-type ribon-helix-helix transcriptional regulator